MLFNSIAFLIFLPTVFILFWFVLKPYHKLQNLLIVVASYIFYGWWDYRFLFLIFISTIVDYIVGLFLATENRQKARNLLLWLSLSFNLGILGVFKYYDFFLTSLISTFQSAGIELNIQSLNIILPVGISFYTFQTLSYTIDVWKRELEPTRNFINFAGFVSFFPQLVAGPIERASSLLPQFNTHKKFNSDLAISGINLIIWGLFKKVVIADNAAVYSDAIFENYENHDSLTLILGAFYFAFQIYGDFSGYSDIAIGTGRLFGFRLMRNFNYPYFSRNIGEFWKRWHISLSTWFRDYVYIPLGGSRMNKFFTIRNILIVFLLSGLWHGANWTFILWGGIHAFLFLPVFFLKNSRQKTSDHIELNLRNLFRIIFTFSSVCFAWIFFRAENLFQAFDYIKILLSNLNFKIAYLSIERYNIELVGLIVFFVIFEWLHRHEEHPFYGKYRIIKLILVILIMLVMGKFFGYNEFIYFQF
ncbi:MBOAT family O-acyltransferase [Christiangramia sp. ASW11-125]|uniref:MBOAT family O-acyltransferase n=1 Tax=Christiangramia sp. ASW11-125 TaxID=3400701 RepID=UPI003AAAA620